MVDIYFIVDAKTTDWIQAGSAVFAAIFLVVNFWQQRRLLTQQQEINRIDRDRHRREIMPSFKISKRDLYVNRLILEFEVKNAVMKHLTVSTADTKSISWEPTTCTQKSLNIDELFRIEGFTQSNSGYNLNWAAIKFNFYDSDGNGYTQNYQNGIILAVEPLPKISKPHFIMRCFEYIKKSISTKEKKQKNLR